MEILTKVCIKCKESKPATLEFFYKLKHSKDNLAYLCKSCYNIRCRGYWKKWHQEDPERHVRKANREKERYHRNMQNPAFRAKKRKQIREYSKRNKERVAASTRMSKIKRYGLSFHDFHSILLKQKGGCAVCKRDLGLKCCIDHCHQSNRVRGLLCNHCNTTLGHLGDTSKSVRDTVARLLEYLDS